MLCDAEECMWILGNGAFSSLIFQYPFNIKCCNHVQWSIIFASKAFRPVSYTIFKEVSYGCVVPYCFLPTGPSMHFSERFEQLSGGLQSC